MDKDALRMAIKALEEDLIRLNAEVKKRRQAINTLYETLGEMAPYDMEDQAKPIRQMRPDLFYGRVFAEAVSEFLSMEGHACSVEEIIRGLEAGGFDFPWDTKVVSVCSMSITKNSLFHKLPNGTFGLMAWYPSLQPKRKKIAKNEDFMKDQESLEQENADNGGESTESSAEAAKK